MNRLLVTGASGFLGWHVCQAARSDWMVFGTYSTHPVAIAGVTILPIDLCDRKALAELFAQVNPDAVIHCAAQSQPNWCELNPELSYQINVEASCHIAEQCCDRNIPCVFTSSDQVFDGTKAPYTEAAPVAPLNRYGGQKVAAEMRMRSCHAQTIVCRMPLMFGVTPHAASFIQPWLDHLRQGQTLRLFVDEIRTPASGITAAAGLLLALHHQPAILHLGGVEQLSRYDFGLQLAEMAQLPTDLICPCQQSDVPMAAPRPQDVSLNSQQAFALGYQPLAIAQELQRIL